MGGHKRMAAVGVAVAASCMLVAAISISGAATGRPRTRHVCRTAKVHVRKHRTRRIHFCVKITPLRFRKLVVHTHSGGGVPPSSRTDAGDVGPAPRLARNRFHRLSKRPAVRSIVGVVTPTRGPNALPPSGPLDVSVATSDVIPISATPERPTDTFQAGEPSVADAGRVVMYTFNWDAVFSTDGGQTWTEVDPHTTFPADDGGFGCDQVVQYDPKTKMFIWVLQYHCASTGVDLERIAWTSASNLALHGAAAWKTAPFVDLQPEAIAGKNTFLDQPRLGFTPTFLYISLNEGTMSVDSSGNFTNPQLKHGVVVRIPRTAFTGSAGSLPIGAALLDTTSMRVAQNVQGSTEFFVGHNGDGQLRIAWIDDSSDLIDDQVVSSSTIATDDWSSTTPGGDDMLGRQQSSQGNAITGVTQGGDGTVWAAWSEGRQLPDGTHKFPQPHVAFAELNQIAGHSGFTLIQQREYFNSRFAYALPDLATDASGEVAFDVYWGGGGLFFANHAIGFIRPRDHRINAFEPVADQLSSSDSPFSDNPFFDYETVRALPHSDCLAAAGVVNRKDSAGVKVGFPVFTIFSRPGVRCLPRFTNLPIVGLPGANAPPPAPQQSTGLTLNCPTTGTVGSPIGLSGAITPALGGRTITIGVGGAASTTFTTGTQSDGSYGAMSYAPSAAGQYTFQASYGGENGFLPSSSPTCTVTVSTLSPGKTSVSLTCPSEPGTPGSPIALTGVLSPSLGGRQITLAVSGPESAMKTTLTQSNGSFSFSYTPTQVGTYTFVASFAGEPSHQPSSSPPCNVPVEIP